MIKPIPITNKSELNSAVKKNAKVKIGKHVSPSDVLTPNGGSVMYDENIANRSIKSKLNSIIGKK